MSELGDAKGIDARVNEGMAHEQNHVELKQRSVTLAVWVHGAHHEEDEVEKKWCPANHKRPKYDGESQYAPHAVAPPPQLLMPPTAIGQGSNLPGMDAWKYEHVYVQEVNNHQGDNEEDHEAAHDEVGNEEPHHEHGWDGARGPDGTQDGPRALHGHDVVVAESMEDGDIPESESVHEWHKTNNKNKKVRPVHSNRQEAEDGAQKAHAQQGVHHVIQLQLQVAHLPQVAHVCKRDHHVLPRLGDAGDGVEGRQAADEAVHGRVKVPVPQNGHHDQQVLSQAHKTDGEEDVDGNVHLGAVGSVSAASVHC